jgi:hypothetical protein
MEIYIPLSAEGFELCQPVNQDDYETIILEINGNSKRASWVPIPVRLVLKDEGKRLITSDAPWLGSHALVFRRRVIDVLGTLLRNNGEILPLNCKSADLSIFNVTNVVDALDERSSDLTRFSSGRLMRVNKYMFYSEVIRGLDLFKIPNLRMSPTFVSERFVNEWTAAGFSGLIFNRVWTCETK